MKVYINLETNNSGVKTNHGCIHTFEFQTIADAKEVLREIQKDAIKQGLLAKFISTSCDTLRVADPHPNGKWFHWNYTIKRLNPKK